MLLLLLLQQPESGDLHLDLLAALLDGLGGLLDLVRAARGWGRGQELELQGVIGQAEEAELVIGAAEGLDPGGNGCEIGLLDEVAELGAELVGVGGGEPERVGLRVGWLVDPEPALALGDDLLVGAVVGGGVVEEQGAEVGELEGVGREVDGAARGEEGGLVAATTL